MKRMRTYGVALLFLAPLSTLVGHHPYIERAWTMRTNFSSSEARRL